MIRLSLQGRDELGRALSDIEREQLPFATALALNRTAQAVKTAQIEAMRRVFDRPTRFTLNSLFIKPATKRRLEAKVWVKDYASKAVPPTRWLTPEVFGGGRGEKRSERLLQARGILTAGRAVLPGRNVRLDGHGNVSRGMMQKILSGLQAQQDRYANSTDSRRSDPNRRRFFVLGRGANAVGIAERTGKRRSSLKLLLAFGGKPNYNTRLDFFRIADNVVERTLADELDRSLTHAVATAKLR